MSGKTEGFQRREQRVRTRIRRQSYGRPRLSVFRSGKHIYAQVIDDSKGHTVVAASTLDASIKGAGVKGADKAAAEKVGQLIAELAKAAGVTQVVFDRNGRRYGGRLQALADAARAKGLQF